MSGDLKRLCADEALNPVEPQTDFSVYLQAVHQFMTENGGQVREYIGVMLYI
tara:strand:- start:367 stop:522 length:156 start_codon:yes stop_codon:yes gene_type:complete